MEDRNLQRPSSRAGDNDEARSRRIIFSRTSLIARESAGNTSRSAPTRNLTLSQYEMASPLLASFEQQQQRSSNSARRQLEQMHARAAAAVQLAQAAQQQQQQSQPAVHPSFRSKSVCTLNCRFCSQGICKRGMKAILLADTRVELYSTDAVPAERVQLVGEDYLTRNCNCRIRDVACLGCGNVIGYHVTQPCEVCMSACNNGHFWMFHDDAISSVERMDSAGQKALVWSQLPLADKDAEIFDTQTIICR